MINSDLIKNNFPIYKYHPGLIYLDSAATALKPQTVIDKITEYYSQYSANIHRGIYQISETATAEYEKSRDSVAKFVNANRPQEIVFTKGTTEGINMLACGLSDWIKKDDEVVTTIMEHHSNFVPWQQLALKKRLKLKVIDIDKRGELNYQLANIKNQKSKIKDKVQKSKINNVITKKTKILTLTYVSNVTGVVNPVKEIIKQAKAINPSIITVVDGAQAVAHFPIDVCDLGCDFFVFSGHKLFGPTGVGILWGKKQLLEQLPPYQYGGGMIKDVTVNGSTFQTPPLRFEGGTPLIAQAIALGSAVKFINEIGWTKIVSTEKSLNEYLNKKLREAFGSKIVFLPRGKTNNQIATASFNFLKVHPHDAAQVLSENQIAVRAGHHCALPFHRRCGIDASLRVSLSVYNSKEDIDRLIDGLKQAIKLFE